MTVTGLDFDEPVKVIYLIEKNSLLRLVASGLNSGRIYTTDIAESQIAELSAPADLNPIRRHQPIIQEGRLTIPLYHGTSSVSVPSILETGLGGRNIIKELRVVELLGHLVRLCEEQLDVNQDWSMTMVSAKKIALQVVTSSGWNYRHGGVYLTPARSTAARYAAGKQYGSEAIEYFMRLYQRILDERPALISDIEKDIAPILTFIGKARVPILIEVNDVPIQILKSENGNDSEAALNNLEELLNESDGHEKFQLLAQQTNFEATQAISPQHLSIFQIGDTYSYGDENIPLTPYSE